MAASDGSQSPLEKPFERWRGMRPTWWCAASIAGSEDASASRRAQKTTLIDGSLRQVIGAIDAENLAGTCNRALLLAGFAGALRRSELAALEFSELRFEPDGMVVRLRRSNGNQEGAGVEGFDSPWAL